MVLTGSLRWKADEIPHPVRAVFLLVLSRKQGNMSYILNSLKGVLSGII